jgi:2-polyprenyl-3-methyl-5-hydroxy-6-metoxy-1,4-benzoquinol methylase
VRSLTPPPEPAAAYFAREYFELHPGKRKYLRFLIELLREQGIAAGRVLDVGSGYGFLLGALQAAGCQSVGLELAFHAAAESRRRRGVAVVQADAGGAFPFGNASFRAVTLFDVIEHIADPDAMLRRCRQALAPAGLLFVITLNSGSLARPLLGRRWSWHLDPTHVHLFSAATLRAALAAAGFDVVALSTLSNFCCAGEGSSLLKPLRLIGRVVRTPWLGDSLLAVARR